MRALAARAAAVVTHRCQPIATTSVTSAAPAAHATTTTTIAAPAPASAIAAAPACPAPASTATTEAAPTAADVHCAIMLHHALPCFRHLLLPHHSIAASLNPSPSRSATFPPASAGSRRTAAASTPPPILPPPPRRPPPPLPPPPWLLPLLPPPPLRLPLLPLASASIRPHTARSQIGTLRGSSAAVESVNCRKSLQPDQHKLQRQVPLCGAHLLLGCQTACTRQQSGARIAGAAFRSARPSNGFCRSEAARVVRAPSGCPHDLMARGLQLAGRSVKAVGYDLLSERGQGLFGESHAIHRERKNLDCGTVTQPSHHPHRMRCCM